MIALLSLTGGMIRLSYPLRAVAVRRELVRRGHRRSILGHLTRRPPPPPSRPASFEAPENPVDLPTSPASGHQDQGRESGPAGPPPDDPLTDWSSHLFVAGRVQYILLSHTGSLYSAVMYGRGITDVDGFIKGAPGRPPGRPGGRRAEGRLRTPHPPLDRPDPVRRGVGPGRDRLDERTGRPGEMAAGRGRFVALRPRPPAQRRAAVGDCGRREGEIHHAKGGVQSDALRLRVVTGRSDDRHRARGRQAISQRWGHLHSQTPAFGLRSRRCTVPHPAHVASQFADSWVLSGTAGLRAGSPVNSNISGERASHLQR